MLRRHRLLAAVLAALALLAAQAVTAAAAPAPQGMGWTVIDRYGGDADGDGRIDDPTPLMPEGINAFPVRVLPSVAVCEELERATWRVDGEPADAELDPGEHCGAVVEIRGEGDHRVEVLARNRAEVARVTVDDKLIVAIGDSVASGEGNPVESVASGEGNPEEEKPRWLDKGCHRSAAAGFEQAARLLGEVDRRRSITFVNLACSGAEIEEGLLGGYDGIEKDGKLYAPQVDRLSKIAEIRGRRKGEPEVDAVLVSVGANDLRFSEVVLQCANLGDCRKPAKGPLDGRLKALGPRYDDLGDALGEGVPGAPVLISEYFDPTHDEAGDLCKDGPGLAGESEVKWAYKQVLRRLNEEVRTAAHRNHWQYLDEIAADFSHHGYCVRKPKRWVRTFPEAVHMKNALGTLHPNEEGHRAIARRVAGPLAELLDFRTPAPPPSAESDESSFSLDSPEDVARVVWLVPSLGFSLALSLALLSLLIGLPVLGVRALLLLRATWPPDPVEGEREAPDLEGVQLSVGRLLLLAVGVVVLFGVLLLLAGLAGRAILWLRFWSSRLPADQAVSAVSTGELVSTGAVALAIFVSLGLAAAALAWLLDAKGRGIRTTRRGLVAIGLAEVVATIWIGEFRGDQGLRIFVGFCVAALLLHYLVERVLEGRAALRERREAEGDSPKPTAQVVWNGIKGYASGLVADGEPWLLRLYRALPFLFLALALWLSAWTDGTADRASVLVAYAVAAMLFAAPGGIASAGVRWNAPVVRALLVPRIALSVTGLALIVILLARDELWLAAVALTAILLGLLCLAVAGASGNRFAPYGIAVLVSVPLFAGAAAFLHGLDSPELQPVAVLLDDGEVVCGAYVGESDDRLWVGHLVPDERADVHRPRRGSIAPLDAGAVAARKVGPLEPVDLVEPRALELRDELLDDAADQDPRKRAPSCTPSPQMKASMAEIEDPEAKGLAWRRNLAEQYQPELVVDRHDHFWPVRVRSLFAIRDRRATVCRRVAGGSEGCLRLGTPGAFPWGSGAGEYLEYPAADNDVDEQHDQMVAALGTADPDATAAEYYLVHREPGKPISIQYWFFYPFNYQPAGDHLDPGGFHEGDFEGIGVLLSARSEEPRYVWMSRHNAEGRAFPWDDEALSRPDGHPRVFAARGSHATYENCEGQIRPSPIKGLINDRPTCDSDRQLHLLPEATPLIDLSHVGWGCWRGLFGHRDDDLGIYERIPNLLNDAPKSPLWQQKFGGVVEEPCQGIADPGGREGRGEEVVEESTTVPAQLRKGASPLENAIDDCSDWEHPATSGTFMVVCSETALDAYVKSGLEDPGAGIAIEAAGSGTKPPAPASVPAVRRSRSGTYLDDWRISVPKLKGRKEIVTSVYASCPNGDRIVAAHFEKVRLTSEQELTIRDQGPGGTWILVDADGAPVDDAVPFRTKAKDGVLISNGPAPGKYLPCER
ncbi:MAG TPA: GDSL-type esterase/lipase family protein [Solirubrobacterales bacterium]